MAVARSRAVMSMNWLMFVSAGWEAMVCGVLRRLVFRSKGRSVSSRVERRAWRQEIFQEMP
jgi:hypothetical protein